MEQNADLQDAAAEVLTCRDLCGDEREALREWQHENRRLSPAECSEVQALVDAAWAEARNCAGVSAPLSPSERNDVFRRIG